MKPSDCRLRSLELADLVYLRIQRGDPMNPDEFKEALMNLELAKIYATLATG
jgi:hypothetical protein